MRATKVNAGLAESNGKILLGIWRDSLNVTCGLTACTPGSAPGPTLGNEYGKTLPFTTGRPRAHHKVVISLCHALFRVSYKKFWCCKCPLPPPLVTPLGMACAVFCLVCSLAAYSCAVVNLMARRRLFHFILTQ